MDSEPLNLWHCALLVLLSVDMGFSGAYKVQSDERGYELQVTTTSGRGADLFRLRQRLSLISPRRLVLSTEALARKIYFLERNVKHSTSSSY